MTLDKILKKLPKAVVEEMDEKGEDALMIGITGSEQALAKAKQELEDNHRYQEAKENVKALSQGYRDLKGYQTAKIQYALLRLKELGKE